MKIKVDHRAHIFSPGDIADKIERQLTLDNPDFLNAQKYGGGGHGIKPKLHYFEWGEMDDQITLSVPRGALKAINGLLLSSGIKPKYEDRRLSIEPIQVNFRGNLRPYQQKALANMQRLDQGVLQAGTGSGKTVMALALLAERKQPALILVHGKELMHQWAERIRSFLEVEPGLIGDGNFDVQPVSVGIVNTVQSRLKELAPLFGQVIVDECHRCPADMFSSCVNYFPAKYRTGLSATPYRRDRLTRVIEFFVGPTLHRVSQKTLEKSGAILKPEIITRRTDFFYPGNAAENYPHMLKELTGDKERNLMIARDIKSETERGAGTCLVVSDRVKHLKALEAILRNFGLNMDILTGKTPESQRKAIVEGVQAGDIYLLGSTVQLIGEGFDCPGFSSLFLTTPVKSRGRLIQIVGRILRPLQGKKPRVFDYVDYREGVLEASARTRQETYRRSF